MADGQVQPDSGMAHLVDKEVRVSKIMQDMLVKYVTKIKVYSKEHSHVEGFSFWSTNLKGDEIEVFRTELGE